MNLAIGFFDGVHLGHRRILAQADCALTFVDHPRVLTAPDRAPALLMTRAARLAAIAAALRPPADGASDAVRVRALDFTPARAAQTPGAFLADLRAAYPQLTQICCGANWRFGAGGVGDADFARRQGLAVTVVPYVVYDGAPVSSTRIRAALAAGALEAAQAMLGDFYTVSGAVVPGKGLGRTLGFPTLNVRPDNPFLPRLLPPGVYAAETPWGRAVANYGRAPTLGAQAWPDLVLEVHLLSAVPPPDLAEVQVKLRRFLRPERPFASVAALARQIRADCAAARA